MGQKDSRQAERGLKKQIPQRFGGQDRGSCKEAFSKRKEERRAKEKAGAEKKRSSCTNFLKKTDLEPILEKRRG